MDRVLRPGPQAAPRKGRHPRPGRHFHKQRKAEVRLKKFKADTIRPKAEKTLADAIEELLKEAEAEAAADNLSRNHLGGQVRYGKVWKELLPGKTLSVIGSAQLRTAAAELKARGVQSRACSLCLSPYRAEIDRHLADGKSCRWVARWLQGLNQVGNHRALNIHQQRHLGGDGATGQRRPKTRSTVNRHLATLQGLFTWAMDKGYCTGNPVAKLKREARKKPFWENNQQVRILT